MRPIFPVLLVSALLLCVVPLAAQTEPPRTPVLLKVHIPNGNLMGPHYQRDLLVLTSGAVTTYDACGFTEDPALLRSMVGQIRPARFADLQRALTANRVGQQSGSCGTSPRGGPQRYDVTWFGRNGRSSTFSLGAFPTDCSEEQKAIVSALLVALAEQDAVAAPVGFGDLLTDCP